MSLGTKKQQQNQLTVFREISNYGIYCQGSSKCIITLQRKLALSTWRAAGAGAGCHSNREIAKYSLPGAGPLKVEWLGRCEGVGLAFFISTNFFYSFIFLSAQVILMEPKFLFAAAMLM